LTFSLDQHFFPEGAARVIGEHPYQA
jgi:hypothetical protein